MGYKVKNNIDDRELEIKKEFEDLGFEINFDLEETSEDNDEEETTE